MRRQKLKYKVGDKVKIVEKNYSNIINDSLNSLGTPFVVTISCDHRNGYYTVEENNGHWWKGNIKGIYVPTKPIVKAVYIPPIVISRFELMDLDQ